MREALKSDLPAGSVGASARKHGPLALARHLRRIIEARSRRNPLNARKWRAIRPHNNVCREHPAAVLYNKPTRALAGAPGANR